MTTTATFTAGVVEYMEDGVMAVSKAGVILVFNPAAERILGIEAQDVCGRTLAACFMHDDANDEFNEAIFAALAHKDRMHNAGLDYLRQDGSTVTLDIKSSFFTLDLLGAEQTGVIIVFNDVTYLKQLEKTQQNLNQELAVSYRKLEETNQRLIDSHKKKRLVFILSAVFVVLVFIPLGYRSFQNIEQPADRGMKDVFSAPSGQAVASMQKAKAVKQPMTSDITMAGRLEPFNIVNLICPFDSQVADKLFGYGQMVKKGEPLLRLATDQIETQLREAESSLIKARQEYEKFQNWEREVEMNQAKRQMQRAKMTLDSTRSKLEETKLLLDKGIVQRSEYDSLREQYQNNLLEMKNVEEALAEVQKKGRQEHRDIAKKGFETAQAKADELAERLSRHILTAPVDGIVIRPIATRGEKDASAVLEKGVNVSRGSVLLAIGNLDGLSVRSKIDEMEITKIRPGLKAKVRGDAFPGETLDGVLSDIAAQAAGEAQGPPLFDVLVTVPHIPPDIARKIRVGMTAQVAITVYDNPNAVQVPIRAVRRGPQGRSVLVVDPATGKTELRPVQTGLTTMGAVEILSGLAGDEDILIGE